MNISDFIVSSAGKFVSVTFTKKDGTERKLNGRIGVTKYIKGGKSTVDHDKYLVVFDNVARGYRCVNRNTIKSVTCGGLTIVNNKALA